MFRSVEPYREFGLKWMLLLLLILSLYGALLGILIGKQDVSEAILFALLAFPLTVFSVECVLWAFHRLRGGGSE